MRFFKRKTMAIFLSLIMVISILTGCSNSDSRITSEKSFSILKASANEENVLNIVNELTSEKYDGRLAGTSTNKLAEDYIADYFKKIDLQSPKGIENYRQTYKQPSIILNSKPIVNIIDKNNKIIKEFEFLKNFQVNQSQYTKINGETTAPIYFLKDIDSLSITNKDLEGKIILIPENIIPDSTANQAVRDKLSLIKNLKGIVYERNLSSRNLQVNHFTNSVYAPPNFFSDEKGPVIITCESDSFKEMLEASKSGYLLKIKVDYTYKEVNASNIVGLIEGSDSKLKDEYIIISGHFDHLGNNKNGTYNPGALDNSSGTASLMEIARALKESKLNPKKSILFVAFNGEEEGLYGSKYFASKPLCDLNKAVMINMDMVGHKNQNPLTLYSTKDSKLIEDLSKYAKELNISTVKEKGDRSDHAPIETKGAQAVTLIEMEMAEYHSFKDTPDKLDKNDIKKVVDLIVYYISKNAY